MRAADSSQVAIGFIVVGLMLAGCSSNPEVSQDTSAVNEQTAPATSSASPEATITAESFLIPSGLDAEQAGKFIFEEAISTWINIGANDELLDKSMEENTSIEALADKLAAENLAQVSGLFKDDWQSDPSLSKMVHEFEGVNSTVIQWYGATAWNEDSEEGFRSWSTVDSSVELADENPDDNVRHIEITITDHNNSDLNSGPSPESKHGVFRVTLDANNGQEVITQFVNMG